VNDVTTFDLRGKVALITGAGRGVGAGIASALAGQGAAIAVNDLSADSARSMADGLVAGQRIHLNGGHVTT
jgi:NAD(P)-dependent dehydrogenase (short-subunit alcohol dehydrogenase family)